MSVRPVSALERVDAILADPATYALAAVIPPAEHRHGGRRRQYPGFMFIVFEALISVYGSARQVEAELSHPLIWQHVCAAVRKRFGDQPDLHLPATPMRRHHYLYARKRAFEVPGFLDALSRRHRELATRQAEELGLCDPNGPGSWTHPHLSRMIHADGKVITPLYRAKPGDTRLDKTTGEVLARRAERDASLHFEGDGEIAWGTKFVLVAARTDDPHGRVILDIDWVPKPGGEAATAMGCFERVAPLLSGAQGVIYDTALRGVHHQRLLRDLGWLSLNRVTAAVAGADTPRRDEGQREPKSAHVEDKTIQLPNGRSATVRLYARDGAIGIGTLTDTGNLHFTALERVRTHRNRDANGKYRWYNDYQLSENLGGGIVTVRLHGTDDDTRRKFNRTENVRPIPADDPDFARLYRRRNDAESINRGLDDSLWLGRAHSVGHERQHLNLIGFALMVNSLARARHRKRAPAQAAA
jgi:hypothetical protein